MAAKQTEAVAQAAVAALAEKDETEWKTHHAAWNDRYKKIACI